MLVTLAIVLSILAFLILLGYPLVAIFFSGEESTLKVDSISALALSLLIGFGFSAFASATSYGITGINTYFIILIVVLVINWTILILKKRSIF